MTEEKGQTFEEWVATEYSVERNKLERATIWLHCVLEPVAQLRTFAFISLWVAADSIFFAAENIDQGRIQDFF